MAKGQLSEKFLRQIPKADLHIHLDGSLRLPTLIDLAQQYKVDLPSFTQEGLQELVFKDSYQSLEDYLQGFAYTGRVLRTAEALERVAYELAQDVQQEGVFYLELRLAPQLHIDNQNLTFAGVLQAVNRGLEKAASEFNQRIDVISGKMPPFKYGIIVCAMRMCGPKFSPFYQSFFAMHQYTASREVIKMAALEMAQGAVYLRDHDGLPIVGIDLAGQENGHPADHFVQAYAYAHQNFMGKTVHAGEAYGAESIFQALASLHADRIGHGLNLFDASRIQDKQIQNKQAYIEALSRYIAERRIAIEVCLTSNLQTVPQLGTLAKHSARRMLEHNIAVVFCTDNRLVSHTTSTLEYQLAVDNFNLNPHDLFKCIVYGFKRGFFPGPYNEKRKYVRQVIDYYQSVAQRFNLLEETMNPV